MAFPSEEVLEPQFREVCSGEPDALLLPVEGKFRSKKLKDLALKILTKSRKVELLRIRCARCHSAQSLERHRLRSCPA